MDQLRQDLFVALCGALPARRPPNAGYAPDWSDSPEFYKAHYKHIAKLADVAYDQFWANDNERQGLVDSANKKMLHQTTRQPIIKPEDPFPFHKPVQSGIIPGYDPTKGPDPTL